MKVRRVGVRRVWDCMLCACVSEEGGDGKGAGSETPSLLSYILRYISLAEHGVRHTVPGWVARSDAPVYMGVRGRWGRGGCGLRNPPSGMRQVGEVMCVDGAVVTTRVCLFATGSKKGESRGQTMSR
jgi:hypothetical protein